MRLLAAVAVAIVAASMVTPAHGTTPGRPRVAQPPTRLYEESFEHAPSLVPVLLSQYTGADDTRYVADEPWLADCNGSIVAFSSPEEDWSVSGCPLFQPNGTTASGSYAFVRMMAYALGVHEGETAAAARDNRAVAAFTANTPPGADLVELATDPSTPIVFAARHDRFIDFSVDAAELCAPPGGGEHAVAEFEFSLVGDSGPATPAFTDPIEPCHDDRAEPIVAPGVGNRQAGATFEVGTFASDRAVLFSGDSLGIEMRNAQGESEGNDAAIDDIRVLDATPQLDKSFSPTVLERGRVSLLTFTITNTTDLAAKDGWSFVDALPHGLVVASPSEGSTTCSDASLSAAAGSGTISVRGSLAAEQTDCTVTVAVTSETNGVYTDGPADVTVSGVNPPGDATVEFGDADVAIAKSVSASVIEPGSNLTYTLTVTNHGPLPAANVVVADPLDGLPFVSASTGCVQAADGVRCTLGSLAAGASHAFTVEAHVPEAHRGGVVNTATVSSDTPDPDHGNNESTISVPSATTADLAIRKVASADRVVAGDQLTYTLVVANRGPHDADDVTVTDPLAPSLLLVSAVPSQGRCDVAHGVVCTLGTLLRGASAQILVTVHVAGSASGAQRNTAAVLSAETDPDESDNRAEASVEVTPVPVDPLPHPGPSPPVTLPEQHVSELRMTKRSLRPSIFVGEPLTYVLTVENLGPDPATDVRLSDTASLGRSVLEVRPSHGACRVDDIVICELGTLGVGDEATVHVVVESTRAGVDTNNVTVTAAQLDPRPEQRVAATRVTVGGILRLRKETSAHVVRPGQHVVFRIRVSNATAGPIRGVTVCDALPAGLALARASSGAVLRAGRLCWTPGTLVGGQGRTYLLVARVLDVATRRLVNEASATAPGARPAHARATVEVRAALPLPGGVTG